jgi:hypothetical protein
MYLQRRNFAIRRCVCDTPDEMKGKLVEAFWYDGWRRERVSGAIYGSHLTSANGTSATRQPLLSFLFVALLCAHLASVPARITPSIRRATGAGARTARRSGGPALVGGPRNLG